MFLSNLSIKHPVFATMMMVALAVLGIVSYQSLTVDFFPDVEFPVITVITVYPGASPETVEREVSKKIEEAINTVEGVKTLESTSQEGLSSIVIQFHLEVSTQTASQDIRSKIAAIRGTLPAGDRGAHRPAPRPRRDAHRFGGRRGLGPDVVRRRRRMRRRSSNAGSRTCVESVPPTSWASPRARSRSSWTGRSSRPTTSRSRTSSPGCRRENVDVPAGSADRGTTEALVRVAARGRTAPDIAQIPLKRAGNTTIRVSDVAQVVDGIRQPKNIALLDERPALALNIQKQSGANTVAVADGVRKAIDEMQKDLPPGVSLRVVTDMSTFIRESIHDVNTTMIIGAILTVFIVYLFLNSWRSTVITGLTLPISIVAGFIAMRAFGFTLNVLTLMGLSLAIGMLIDDAIVVRENIVRHLQRGKDHFDAARDGTAEIGLAVMATTFTIIAVFVPVAFMGGMVGRIFYEFGITVAAAVARLPLRQLHPRPHALLALGGSRYRARLSPPLHRPDAGAVQRVVRRSARASTRGFSTGRCDIGPSFCSWPPWRSSEASRSSESSAATSCPTSTVASTRWPSRPRPVRR